MRIHVLTAGFATPNGQAFLMPLILHRRALADLGMSVRLFDGPAAELTECDVLLLDGKYFGPRWTEQSASALEEIAAYRSKVNNLIYVDLLDSAGWDHARALPYVNIYCKSQVLRDRSLYLRPLYGYRAFADYYHREMGVEDDVAVFSEPVSDPALLNKLTVSWNSALADYSWLGPYRMNTYYHVPLRALLRLPKAFHAASARRSCDVSCRMGIRYTRETVSFQRKKLAVILQSYQTIQKLSRRRYIAELCNSKVVISPFGYGEITLRDFEIFMNGALMLKPDMSGVETWPDLYRNGETMIAHQWDLSDVLDKVEAALSDERRRLDIAEQGQATYRRYLCGPDAGMLFAAHLEAIIAKGETPAISTPTRVSAGQ